MVLGLLPFTAAKNSTLCRCAIDWPAWQSGLGRSVRASFVPFYELRDAVFTWSTVIAFMQSLTSIALIAVFLVTLRWRFKRG